MSFADGQMAAIALGKGFALATRNTKDFKYCKVKLVNPFEKT
jgi:predicted nucleic acid-binding protein